MCVPADAQLPALEGTGHRPGGERVWLMSDDGTRFAGYQVAAHDATQSAVVLLPDVRGLFGFYEALAESFASIGLDAIAIDYFGRTSNIDERGDDWEYWPHVEQTTPEQVRADVAAALTKLRADSAAKRFFTVGFCFGGGQSLAQAAAGHGLSGVISYYGPPRKKRDNFASPIDLVDEFECPVLAMYGGADEGIPETVIKEFDDALRKADVPHQIHIYPGAPHSFFDRSYADYAEECADSWQRMRTFIATT